MIFRRLLRKFANSSVKGSLADKFRNKRFSLFKQLIHKHIDQNISILDVGGTEIYWERMGLIKPNVHITLLNLKEVPTKYDNLESVSGDARNMSNFDDNYFYIIHSNSVIEHVGNFSDQQNMANEVKRVGKSYFVQTPNYYFPIEPHFLFVGFQFLPLKVRAFLIRHFNLGWYKKTPDYEQSIIVAKSARLLKKSELTKLFPKAKIYKEKIFGLTKSFIVYDGFDTSNAPSNHLLHLTSGDVR